MKLSFTIFLTAVLCIAQQPAFEVTSVKVNRSGDGSSSGPRLANGRLTAKNTPLKSILQAAYGLGAMQVTGPGWIDSDRFDLEAKSPVGIPDTEIMPMLQALLKDRFNLVAHKESKEMPVYDLIVGKDGLKCSPMGQGPFPPVPPRPNGADAALMGPMTMDELAGNMTSAAGRPIINKTGIEGRRFCIVFFSKLSAQANDNTDASGPGDLFAAIQRQLGLKLEPSKARLDVLIVDSAERVPAEN